MNYTKNIIDLLEKQRQKGIAKYGQIIEDKEKAAVSEKVHRKTFLEDFLKNSPTLTVEEVVIDLCVKERYKSIPETEQFVCDKNCRGCWNSVMPEEK